MMLKLKKTKDIINLTGLLVVAFILIASVGTEYMLEPLNTIMKVNPVPRYYFPIFFLVGVIIPILAWFINYRDRLTNELLRSYLFLLLCQIILEIVFVITTNKGMGVFIGFTFSIIRVVQIIQFLKNTNIRLPIRILFLVQASLWTVNIIQIITNRIIPII